MQLPETLRVAIDRELEAVNAEALARAAAEISDRYRETRFAAPVMRDAAHRAAYVAARMPATYAVLTRVFAELAPLAPHIHSVLDLGAGPGTAMWAARTALPWATTFTGVERDGELVALAQRLAASDPALAAAQWSTADLARADYPAHDLVVLSYALGELPESGREAVIGRAWQAARVAFVVVEPGTPRGFALVHAVRARMIAERAPLAAPCPHRQQCPMQATGDWCHFAARVERTAQHRRLKGGMLGHEDEKFAYLIAAREPTVTPASRILRHPLKHSGHVQLLLCRPDKPERITVGKSQKQIYRAARKAEWGDGWPPLVPCEVNVAT